MDIISDEPIKEPVEVVLKSRFLNVYDDGTVVHHLTREQADANASFKRIGVYELPERILVTPK